jgi:hypothetical protein
MTKIASWKVILPAAGLLLAGLAFSQHGDMAAIGEAFRQNEDRLRALTWKSRAEGELDGEIVEIALSQVAINDADELEGVPIRDAELGGSGKKPSKKLRQFFANLRALFHDYTHLTPEQRQRVFDQALLKLGRGSMEDTFHLKIDSVIKSGDNFDLWVDGASKKPRRLRVMTSMEGEPLKFVVDFEDLPDGTKYPAHAVVESEVKEKQMLMRIETFDHEPRQP